MYYFATLPAALDVWLGALFTAANVLEWVTGEGGVYTGNWNGSYPTYLATHECMQMWVTHAEPGGMWQPAMCSSSAVYVCEKDMA